MKLRRAVSIFGMLLLLTCSSSASFAQERGGLAPDIPVLLEQVTAGAQWPPVPMAASNAMAVRLDASALERLRPGSRFLVRLGLDAESREEVVAQVAQEQVYVNGDRMLSASLGEGYSSRPLVMTVGSEVVLAQLEGEDSNWQLQVEPVPGAEMLGGWLYQARIPDMDWRNDFVVPQPTAETRSTLPLKLEAAGNPSPSLQAARTEGINAGNFSIEQHPAANSVIAGDQVTVEVRVSNTSQEQHRDLVLDIHFALDNSALLAMSQACSRQTTTQGKAILSCRLGDFQPGESKQFSYTVQSSISSKPYIASTAIIGALRNDAWINVVDNVMADSDADGISDFNEQLLATDPLNPASVDRSETVIDIMALFTPATRTLYGSRVETRINQMISVANQIYRDSGVGIVLRPVYHGQVDYPAGKDMGTQLDQLTRRSHTAFSQVDLLRSRYGADLVVLFRPQGLEVDRCGLANLAGRNTRGDFMSSSERDYAYSIVALDCPVSSALAHELGHSMGLTHSRREDGGGGTLPWATGYGVDSSFVTVMAFPDAFNTDVRLPRFSSPNLDCLGQPCGVDAGDTEQGADAVQVLNLVRHQVAAYSPTRVADLTPRNTGRTSGAGTDASIASAASVDGGLSYVQSVMPGQVLDVSATVRVDSADAGKPGAVYVLIAQGNGSFHQLTAQGELSTWDGRMETLMPFREEAILAPVEYVSAVKGLPVEPGFAGERLSVFIAYRVTGSEDVVYTLEPLVLSIDFPR